MSDSDVVFSLKKNRQIIFSIWEARVRNALPVARQLDSLALTNSLPDLYDCLINTLLSNEPKKYLMEVAKEIGKTHGEERSHFKDYDLNHVIEEYQILRQVIFDKLRESESLSDKATDAIIDAISVGIRNATCEFVKQKRTVLAQAYLRAEQANIAKTTFLANMSHEIRTPLGAILGFADLIKDTESKSERDEYLNVIIRNGKALTTLIDDVLDLSKVEAGRLDIEHISFPIKDLVQEITELFQETLRAKNVLMSVDFHVDLPRFIKTDPTRLRQILINIIGNAVKFTHTGSVKIKVEPILFEEKMIGLMTTVIDTGVGMTEEDSLSLFQPFSQADSSTSRKFGGTGLGLVLSRRLARALGGDVELKSCEKDKGCIFIVTIAATATSLLSKNINHNSAHKLDHIKILLVEDSVDNQYLIKHILESKGAIVDIAPNGKKGVQMVLEDGYDVVLMDIQMPGLDGYVATKELRAKGFKKPIIALTAHALADERRKTKEAGCDAHLTKPIDTNLLVETLREFSEQNQINTN